MPVALRVGKRVGLRGRERSKHLANLRENQPFQSSARRTHHISFELLPCWQRNTRIPRIADGEARRKGLVRRQCAPPRIHGFSECACGRHGLAIHRGGRQPAAILVQTAPALGSNCTISRAAQCLPVRADGARRPRRPRPRRHRRLPAPRPLGSASLVPDGLPSVRSKIGFTATASQTVSPSTN